MTSTPTSRVSSLALEFDFHWRSLFHFSNLAPLPYDLYKLHLVLVSRLPWLIRAFTRFSSALLAEYSPTLRLGPSRLRVWLAGFSKKSGRVSPLLVTRVSIRCAQWLSSGTHWGPYIITISQSILGSMADIGSKTGITDNPQILKIIAGM